MRCNNQAGQVKIVTYFSLICHLPGNYGHSRRLRNLTGEASTETPNRVSFLVHGSYLIIEDLVNPHALEELKADTNRISRGYYPNKSLKPLPADMSDTEVLMIATSTSPDSSCKFT